MDQDETKPRRQRKPVDGEIRAMQEIATCLDELDAEARRRVLQWIAGRYASAGGGPAVP